MYIVLFNDTEKCCCFGLHELPIEFLDISRLGGFFDTGTN